MTSLLDMQSAPTRAVSRLTRLGLPACAIPSSSMTGTTRQSGIAEIELTVALPSDWSRGIRQFSAAEYSG
jgi:hypothetical protein